MLTILKKANKKIVLSLMAIIFLTAIIYFAWYWYRIIQEINWGKNISLGNSLSLKINGRAYYKKDQIQIQLLSIDDSPNDSGAQFSATNYKDGGSAKFYLNKITVPQIPLFNLQVELLDVNTNNNTAVLKITRKN